MDTYPPSGHEAERALRLLRVLIDRADVMLDVAQTALQGGKGGSAPDAPPQTGRRRRAPRFTDPKWEALARPGVGSIVFGTPGSRDTPASIDGAPAFLLPNGLAGLLAALVRAADPAEGGFNAFVELIHLAARRGCSVHGVTAAIGRLRTRLLQAGHVSPLLVETRVGAVRVRLRRVTDEPFDPRQPA